MAKGLPDVTQKVGMDADKYFTEGDKVIDKNVELGDSSDDLAEKFERNQMMVDAFAIRLGQLKEKLESNKQAVRDYSGQLGELQNKLISAQAAQERFNSTEATLDRLSAAYENFNDKQEKAFATALQTGKILKDQASAYKSVGDALTYGVLDSFERVKNQQDASLMTLKQLKAAQEDLAVQITQTGSEAAISGAKTKQAFADYHEGATRAIMLTRQLAQESSLLAPGGNFGGGGTAAALTTLRGGGDGSGAAAAFLGDAFAGGGAGIGGIGGFGGGGGGGGGLMTAAEYANNVTAFTKRWAAAAHYAVMGTMEALSTIVPATVALGGAAAVSIQAGEQIANRGQAIMSTAEALGIPAYGLTAGNLVGVGGALQTAQNRYNGGLYGLTGGAMNLAQIGQGAFLQQGGQTMAMLDRAMAAMVLNAQGPQGTAAQLAGALGGGTNFLRQFGDIGANTGDTLLGLAPHLPGVGADWLAALTGITGAAAGGVRFLNTHAGGNVLGAGLAGEAGWRLGTPLLGLLGKGVTGLGGLAGKLGLGTAGMTASDIADIQALTGGALGEGALGLEGLGGSGLAGGLGIAGAALGGVTGPLAAALAIGAWEGGMLGQYKTPVGQGIASRNAAIGAAPFSSAIQPLAAALSWATPQLGASGLPIPGPTGVGGGPAVNPDPRGFVTRQREADQANLHTAIADWTGKIAGTAGAAAQLVPALAKMGIHGASFATALQIATASLLDVNHALDPKTHQLTAPALQQVANFIKAAGGAQMTGAPAPLMAAVAAQTIMGSSQMKTLQNVNSAMDSMTQIMTGGSAGQAALFAMLGGTPVTSTHAGLQVAASAAPATSAFAQALKSPFTAGGSTAWSTFAGQGGLLPTEQQNLDQLRTAMSLGALSPGQAGGLGAFQLMQLLPMARSSPAALANLMSMGMQAGIPGMQYFSGSSTSGKNLAKQYALAAAAISGAAPTANQATTLTNQEAVKLSNLPGVAGQFMQSLAPSQASMVLGDITTQGLALRGAPTNKAALQAIVEDLKSQGVKPGQMAGTVGAILGQLGASKGAESQASAAVTNMFASAAKAAGAEMAKAGAGLAHATTTAAAQAAVQGSGLTAIQQGTAFGAWQKAVTKPELVAKTAAPVTGADQLRISGGTITYKSKVDPPTLPAAPKGPTVNYDSHVHPPDAPPAPKGAPVNYPSHVQTPVAPPAPAGGTVVYHSVVIGPGGAGAGAASLGGVRLLGQHGFKVPGMGSGDIVHAMLEPGELVVPRHMVTSGMVDHLKGKIPGFQGGGIIDVPTYAGGAGIRSALEDIATQLMGFMAQGFAGLSGSLRSSGGYGLPYSSALTGGPPPNSSSPPVPVHIASVAPPAVAALGGSGQFPGAAGPMPKAAMKVIDAFEESFKNMPGPWNKLASQILTGLLDGVKNSTKETAAMATTLVNKVKTEIAYGQGVTATAVAGLNLGGMQVASPTMTAQGKPYQYYIDQQNIAAGGQPGSVQEQMGSYLQAMQSFQGDMGKLAKGGLQKRLLSQLYAAGPVQGDAEAQSILGGAGGIKAANQLYNQINSLATKLGVQAMGEQYGTPGKLTGKTVHAAATVSGTGAVHALQSAISSLHGKTVTVTVNVVEGGGGGGGGGGGAQPKLSKTQTNMVIKNVQAGLLQQAQRNRRTGLTLQGYGS